MEGMEQLTGFVSSVGFPIAMAVWLMVRFDKTLGAINETLIRICEKIDLK